jgi:2-haloacid dehalogenase
VVSLDAVLFDLGKVLVAWDPYLPYAGRCARAQVERFFADIDFFAFNHEQDAGRSWAQARAALGATHPEHLPMLKIYIDHFADSVPGELPWASALVADVQSAGLRALGLTNWSAQTFHVALEKAPVVGRLEGILVSGQERLAKPDPAVFALAASRFGLEPSRTLFTDDAERNVEVAARLGFLTHLFTGPYGLRTHLRVLGVHIPPA